MAQAVKRLFPDVKVTIGPAIEDGFYYDFAKAAPFTPEDLARIEAMMREIVAADLPFERRRCRGPRRSSSSASAASPSRSRSSRASTPTARLPLPAGRLHRSLPRAARRVHRARSRPSSCCRRRAPTGAATRRTRCCGASTGRPGSRQEDLDQYLWRLEEAKKRDHRKLGPRAGSVRLLRRRAGGALLAAQRDGPGARARASSRARSWTPPATRRSPRRSW